MSEPERPLDQDSNNARGLVCGTEGSRGVLIASEPRTPDARASEPQLSEPHGLELTASLTRCQLCQEEFCGEGMGGSLYCFTCSTHAHCVCSDIDTKR